MNRFDLDPEKITDIVIKIDGVDHPAKVGITLDSGDGNARIFGLAAWDPRRREYVNTEHVSHMCYGLDYFKAKDVLEFLDHEDVPFYFDAGTTRPTITCARSEMFQAFLDLGMLIRNEVAR